VANIVSINKQNAADFFAGINDAKEKNRYIEIGNYDLEVLECKGINTRAQRKAFVTEFKVLAAEPGSTNRVGEIVSQMVMLDRGEMAMRDIKAFVSAATGVDFDTVDAEGMAKIVSPSQPLRGKRVGARAQLKPTKAGGKFTEVIYSSPSKA